MGPFFYKIRLAKGSVWSALKVWFGPPVDPINEQPMWDRSPIWRAFLNGEHVPIEDIMTEMDGVTGLPTIKGDACTEEDYLFYLRDHLWAKANKPDDPAANPRQKIDLNALPTLF